MYEIFKNILNGKDYELVDILNKIDEYYIKSKLSKEEKEKLEDEARQNAIPENSYADFQKQIDALAELATRLHIMANIMNVFIMVAFGHQTLIQLVGKK